MEILEVKDNDDGSADIAINLTYDELLAFAKIGIEKSLVDAATTIVKEAEQFTKTREYVSDKDEIECRSRNPAKVCANCSCWKNQNE